MRTGGKDDHTIQGKNRNLIEIYILEGPRSLDHFHTIPVITGHPPEALALPSCVDTFAFLILVLPVPPDYYY